MLKRFTRTKGESGGQDGQPDPSNVSSSDRESDHPTPQQVIPPLEAAVQGGHAGEPDAALRRSPFLPVADQNIGDGSFVKPNTHRPGDAMGEGVAVGVTLGMVIQREVDRLPGAMDKTLRDSDRQRQLGAHWGAFAYLRGFGDRVPEDTRKSAERYLREGPLSNLIPKNEIPDLRRRGIIGRTAVRASHKAGEIAENISNHSTKFAFLGTVAVLMQNVDKNGDGVQVGEIAAVLDRWGTLFKWFTRFATAAVILTPVYGGWWLNKHFGKPEIQTVEKQVASSDLINGSSALPMIPTALTVPAGTQYSSYPAMTTTDKDGREVTVMYRTNKDLAAVNAASVQDQFPDVADSPDGRAALSLPRESRDTDVEQFKYVVANLGDNRIAFEVPAATKVEPRIITGTCDDGSPKTQSPGGQIQHATTMFPISPEDIATLAQGGLPDSLRDQITEC